MPDLKKEIGDRIRKIRLEQNHTQAQFAESIDISINFLSEIENGKKGMSQETIYKLCTHYNVSADYLIFGKQHSENSTTLSKITDLASALTPNELSCTIDYLNSLKRMKDLGL